MPMMLITPICVLQFSVLYIICFASPQYLFASGEWLLPNSASNSLSVMKSFATVLMLGQIAEEFHEISESIKVLRQSRLSFTSRRRLCCCWLCISLQYLLALMVMVTSGQVILGRQNPIEPLWMTYYVFMTLSFDNMLVKFIMYVRTMERHTIWKVEVSQPETPTSKKRTKRLDVAQQVAVLWVPLLLAASVSIFCRLFNVLPITLLRYGPVANEQQVVMFSSLSLPAGCCPSVAQINTSRADTVSVSVPCLSPEAPEDWPHRPLVYWVASASHKAMPTSLQVREGRTGDGSRALLAGHVEAKPLELWSWMSDHGYEATDIDAVLRKLNDETLGIGLYRRTFAYVAEIQVHPFPWFEEVAIYAIARNDVTGALSPKAAVSNVIHGKRCPPHCEICDRQGQCRHCQEGFQKDADSTCRPCPEGCLRCPQGISQCTKCKTNFGLAPYASKKICLPCGSKNCQSCDGPALGAIPPSVLPCKTCNPFYGLDLDGLCQRCEDENCLHCEGGSGCTACAGGFVLDTTGGNVTCALCGPGCLSCTDKEACVKCQDGFRLEPSGKCKACAPNCRDCGDSPDCKPGGCFEGFGYVRRNWFSKPECEACRVQHCTACDHNPHICTECSEDFGVTTSGGCFRCGLGCTSCRLAGSCLRCSDGFVLREHQCKACADRCRKCTVSGPAHCDQDGCHSGWTAVQATWEEAQSFVCRPCSDPDCPKCDIKGPGNCDEVPD
ncbi:unnamed protein product [Durusdinium trenchii]